MLVRFIVDPGCGYPFPFWFGLWLLGNPDLWDRGLVTALVPFFCGLFTPTFPIAWAQVGARFTQSLEFLEGLFAPQAAKLRLAGLHAAHTDMLCRPRDTSSCPRRAAS